MEKQRQRAAWGNLFELLLLEVSVSLPWQHAQVASVLWAWGSSQMGSPWRCGACTCRETSAWSRSRVWSPHFRTWRCNA